jgi:hypothetical protein
VLAAFEPIGMKIELIGDRLAQGTKTDLDFELLLLFCVG